MFGAVRASRRRQTDERLAMLARRIRAIRLGAELTQDELAERSGLDVRVIRYLESGSRDVGVSTLWPLAEALGVPVVALVADEPNP